MYCNSNDYKDTVFWRIFVDPPYPMSFSFLDIVIKYLFDSSCGMKILSCKILFLQGIDQFSLETDFFFHIYIFLIYPHIYILFIYLFLGKESASNENWPISWRNKILHDNSQSDARRSISFLVSIHAHEFIMWPIKFFDE